jgi:CDP-diacylglycerol--glycerol-3-phosphate 3-phosphatidyltransferase
MISAPQLLILFRAVCAPAIFVMACFGWPGPMLAGVLVAGFLSDVFDGMIARRTGTATPALRYADTLVDTVFYAAAAVSLAIAVPGAFEDSWLPLVGLVTIHVSRSTFELTKYGRIASYHMWSSKLLGVLIAVALTYGFIAGVPNPLVAWALWLGIANELEGFATSAILPAWIPDVPSVLHAYRRS